jgi:hypothetical protein
MNAQFTTVGTLSAKSVPSGLNVAGTILRENGRKLYPGANPGVNTYMVGVYHDTIGSGFIDPNAHVFAVYSGSKPYFAADGVDPDTDEKDLSAPVYTRGVVYAQEDITTGADLHVTGDADISGVLVVRGNTDLSGGYAADVTGNTILRDDLTVSGKVYLSSSVVGSAIMNVAPVSNVGSFRYKTVASTAVTANSKIFFTLAGVNNPGTVYSAETLVPGTSFQIVSNSLTDASTVQWLIIN